MRRPRWVWYTRAVGGEGGAASRYTWRVVVIVVVIAVVMVISVVVVKWW